MVKINPIGSGKPDISAVDAAIVSISKEISSVKEELRTQRSESRGVIIGVLVASVLIVATIAVEVLISDQRDREFYSKLYNDMNEQNIKLENLDNNLGNLKIRNPYLK